jgi:hypothetical protein
MFAPGLAASTSASSDSYTRNIQPAIAMNTFLAEAGIFGEYNFFNYRNPKNRYIFGSPYLFGGPILTLIKKGETDNFNPDVIKVRNNIDSTLSPGLPRLRGFPGFVLGVGYKQQLGQYFNIGIQVSGRFLFSDEFDGVSDREIVYTNETDSNGNLIQNPETGNFQIKKTTGSQIGNKSDRDSYYFAGISLTYTIKEVICPFKYEKKTEK